MAIVLENDIYMNQGMYSLIWIFTSISSIENFLKNKDFPSL